MSKVTPIVHLTEQLEFKTVFLSADPLTKKARDLQRQMWERNKKRFKILGQVNNPGFYEVPPDLDLDLLDAIAIAGGYTRLANKITIKYVEGEEEKVETFKLRDLTRSSVNQVPKLMNNATIILGESDF